MYHMFRSGKVRMTRRMSDPYTNHLATLQARWEAALADSRVDAVLLAAGNAEPYFLDDQAPPFRANPHFAQWLPGVDAEGSVLLLQPGRRPKLFFHQADDYWHVPPSTPALPDAITIETFNAEDNLLAAVATDVERINHVAYIGPSPRAAANLPLSDVNPGQLINHIHFGRATKTDFELGCMREASAIAAQGHLAARDTFYAGGSEFEIHQAYLSASRQTEAELPYPNIVALNEHAGVLHYQHYDRRPPARRLNFLIDAGGRHRSYGADVTRTYAAVADSTMAALIARLDAAQQALTEQIRPGVDYLALHEAMHRAVAAVLVDAGLVKGDPDAAFAERVTDHFFPHGLGHLIGLQTHDAGGHLSSPAGGLQAPPERYPALRLTRTIEANQVFTIEPGIYFIPSLLEQLRALPQGGCVDWGAVEALTPAGGVRIEDNVRVLEDNGVENLTRDAFARLESDAA